MFQTKFNRHWTVRFRRCLGNWIKMITLKRLLLLLSLFSTVVYHEDIVRYLIIDLHVGNPDQKFSGGMLRRKHNNKKKSLTVWDSYNFQGCALRKILGSPMLRLTLQCWVRASVVMHQWYSPSDYYSTSRDPRLETEPTQCSETEKSKVPSIL